MCRSKQFYELQKAKLNKELEKNGQNIRVMNFDSKSIVLNNDHSPLLGADRYTFIRRNESRFYMHNMDKIYSTNKNISDLILKEIHKKRGEYAQSKADMTNFLKYVNTKGRPSHNKGKKSTAPIWSKGLTKDTDPRLKRMSEDRKGNNNPAIKHNIFTQEYRENHSTILKNKILSGKFTPNTNNKHTKKHIICKGIKFRSSWESIFYYFNQQLEYETVRIPYIDENGLTRIYIVDFYDPVSKTLYEIKPKEHSKKYNTEHKIKGALAFCEINQANFVVIHQDTILDYAMKLIEEDFINFDEDTIRKIKKFINHETHKKNRNRKTTDNV